VQPARVADVVRAVAEARPPIVFSNAEVGLIGEQDMDKPLARIFDVNRESCIACASHH
jgi:hypothetical protein